MRTSYLIIFVSTNFCHYIQLPCLLVISHNNTKLCKRCLCQYYIKFRFPPEPHTQLKSRKVRKDFKLTTNWKHWFSNIWFCQSIVIYSQQNILKRSSCKHMPITEYKLGYLQLMYMKLVQDILTTMPILESSINRISCYGSKTLRKIFAIKQAIKPHFQINLSEVYNRCEKK